MSSLWTQTEHGIGTTLRSGVQRGGAREAVEPINRPRQSAVRNQLSKHLRTIAAQYGFASLTPSGTPFQA
jgi:hypothetical protein